MWKIKDTWARALLVGGFVFGWFITQGVPMWDDDFTSWFWKIRDQNLFEILWEWIVPISSQPETWGFNERPMQKFWFKLTYLVFGQASWAYFLIRSAVFAGIGVMIYLWSLRLVPATRGGRWSALAAAVFALVVPGTVAAHFYHADFAPVAELLFLILTYWIWNEIEKTPVKWAGFPQFKNPEHLQWLKTWGLISVSVYLAYGAKADLKLIPVILLVYLLIVRRKQLGFFGIPIALMGLLAVPWGKGIFTKLPPFLPGSSGSEIGWMWQPASLDRLMHFFWSDGAFDFRQYLFAPTISLFGILGILLIAMVGFLVWKIESSEEKFKWLSLGDPSHRARLLILIWFAVVTVAMSSLAEINYIFRIRYGILMIVPLSILMAWIFGLFSDSVNRMPFSKIVLWVGVVIFGIQTLTNLNRSLQFRRELGQVAVAVDGAYGKVQAADPNGRLVLTPDFRPYDYWPEAGTAFKNKTWLQSVDQLNQQQPGTWVISWSPSLSERLELVEQHTGCKSWVVFDWIRPCPPGSGAFVMKVVDSGLFRQAEDLRNAGDLRGSLERHEQFLSRHPGSLAGQFVVGLLAYQLSDWSKSEQAYSSLVRYFPNHLGIIYNLALARSELGKYKEAVRGLKQIIDREPTNYAAWINLFHTLKKGGMTDDAREALREMKGRFPNDQEVNRLHAAGV